MSCKLLLNEDFVDSHGEFMSLTEDNGAIDDAVSYLAEAYSEFNAIFAILEDTFAVLNEETPTDDNGKKRTDEDPTKTAEATRKEAENYKKLMQDYKGELDRIEREKRTEASIAAIRNSAANVAKHSTAVETIKSFASDLGLKIDLDTNYGDKKDLVYSPELGMVEKENIKDMGFPKNIIFFIHSLIDWIKRLIISFIARIGNVIKLLFGADKSELHDTGDTKFYLDKFTKIYANGSNPVKPNEGKIVSIYKVNPSDIKTMFTSAAFNEADETLLEAGRDGEDEGKKSASVPFVQINIADDMTDLKMLLDHFFNVFDSSYGSNNEYLFGTDDLEMLLEVFKDALKKVEAHDTSAFYVSGRKAIPLIDSAKLSAQLQTTAVNTDKLKAIYTDINNRVQKILKKVTASQLLTAEAMGGSYKYYSLSTYEEMSRILKILEPKIKEMVKLEKDLTKIKAKFEKLTSDLGKLQKAFTGMTSLVYREGFNNSMQDLFRSARIVTQTVTLRLTTLTMAIKTLRDIKDAIEVSVAVNKKSFNDLKKVIRSL